VIANDLVYLGDTYDPMGIAHLATDCDLLVHEATLERKNELHAKERGHSTAGIEPFKSLSR
jgi:ribonuclease BN (tRNA processing enzyme)